MYPGGGGDRYGQGAPYRGGGGSRDDSRGQGQGYSGPSRGYPEGYSEAGMGVRNSYERGGRGGGRGGRDFGGGGRGPPGAGTNLSPEEGRRRMDDILNKPENELVAEGQAVPAHGELPQLARRPNFGILGKRVTIKANYFKINMSRTAPRTIFHYDVSIHPVPRDATPEDKARLLQEAPLTGPVLPIEVTNRVIKKLSATARRWPSDGLWCYDGNKSLYCVEPALPAERVSWPVAFTPGELEGLRENEFQVYTKAASEVDMVSGVEEFSQGLAVVRPRDVMQVYDVLIRFMYMNDPSLFLVRQATATRIFSENSRRIPVSNGTVELWKGYQQALKLCEGGFMLAVDTTTQAFLTPQPLAKTIGGILGIQERDLGRPLSSKQCRKVMSVLKASKIAWKMQSGYTRSKGLTGITELGANRLEFLLGTENKVTTVAEYYSSSERVLRHPEWPCANVGTRNTPTYLPIEMCSIMPGQRKGNLDPDACAAMIRESKEDPPVKARNMLEKAEEIKQKLVASGYGAKWGLSLDPKALEVPGRILPAPVLAYKEPAAFDPGSLGSWNLKDKVFLVPSTLQRWAVACELPKNEAECGSTSVYDFVRQLVGMMHTCGMTVTDPDPPTTYASGGDAADIGSLVQNAHLRAKQRYGVDSEIQLIVVILRHRSSEAYAEVKLVSDSELGVPSQVIVSAKAGVGMGAQRGGGPQYLGNVAQKINSKIGGVNVGLFHQDKYLPVLGNLMLPAGAPPGSAPSFVVFGCDMSHDGPNDPSIAAVVSSLDGTFGRWRTHLSAQAPRTDIIADMKEAVRRGLVEYYKANRKVKPERLLFYRSGGSEGQVEAVLVREYVAARQACLELGEDYCPQMTWVSVRRHHGTRLLPTGGEGADRRGNLLPGACVDRHIVSPGAFDFFLNSHSGIQGTNKPMLYQVLVDEIGFGAEGIEVFTYWLCYLYQRCTRAVSACPPIYYAGLAAARGRILMAALSRSGSDSSSDAGSVGRATRPSRSSATLAPAPAPEEVVRAPEPKAVPVHHKMQNTMFYM